MVAEPVVDTLVEKEGVHLTVASLFEKDAKKLAKGHPRVATSSLDISNMKSVGDLVQAHDVVIRFLSFFISFFLPVFSDSGFQCCLLCFSLVPATFHPLVAEVCIERKKNMVTASYISPAMQALHDRYASKKTKKQMTNQPQKIDVFDSAVAAGVTILNEIGLDPGIDHLSAMKIIDEVKHEGGKILSFSSVCGGLPAPEASDNPLGYKFSWSPRGVLAAGLNPSKYLYNGKVGFIQQQKERKKKLT